MTSMDDDNPFPDDTEVRVRFPRSNTEEQGHRELCPWLVGVIVSRCGPDEWQVAEQSSSGTYGGGVEPSSSSATR